MNPKGAVTSSSAGPAQSQGGAKGANKPLLKTQQTQNKTTGQQPTKQAKRTLSELSDTSNESMNLSVIQNQLDIMQESMLRKEDIETLITNTITQIMSKMEEKILETVSSKVEEKTRYLQDQLTTLKFDNDNLKDILDKKDEEYNKKIEEIEERLLKSEDMCIEANRKANRNEQYSRKNNIKIYDVIEERNETQIKLTEKVQGILKKENVNLREEDISAIHRLPTKPGHIRPVIIKTVNNTVKTAVMRKRRNMRDAGHRIADDVTIMNSGLINRLTLHREIKSAWFFNGAVYGETLTGERVKFDVYDNIDEALRKAREKKEADRRRGLEGQSASRS